MNALSSPAALRNRGAILEVIRPLLPAHGLVLEVASGTGEHVAHFAAALTGLRFQPSDPSDEARASVAAHCAGLANVLPPLALDVALADWPVVAADVILCINIVHISPWAATEGLMAGAGRLLPAGGLLLLYGPFVRDGVALAPSNAAFDADLRARNARWGLRRVADVEACAAGAGLRLEGVVAMPANNLTLLFRKGVQP
ncbi:DUF938 domain-containing protein [Sandaracinobacteroides saxicola]|uniref:DUF938 domain-containing protein n=1 Tax=Sandaracinobacteroides saxicola TaxID=2759707 RepID=A0A7G5IEI5_9SPHN|nr:DUF938 domain-containing protein [Sandaracinobacteroides saxicola]QMW21777.1 DUF938 domain-containing protein [Sandaracinobacteroides saxicola]